MTDVKTTGPPPMPPYRPIDYKAIWDSDAEIIMCDPNGNVVEFDFATAAPEPQVIYEPITIPAEALSLFDKYSNILCPSCVQGRHITYDEKNNLTGLICNSCRFIIRNAKGNECRKRSPECGELCYVDAMGIVAEMCANCHKYCQHRRKPQYTGNVKIKPAKKRDRRGNKKKRNEALVDALVTESNTVKTNNTREIPTPPVDYIPKTISINLKNIPIGAKTPRAAAPVSYSDIVKIARNPSKPLNPSIPRNPSRV